MPRSETTGDLARLLQDFEEACAGDPALRREIESLLRARKRPGGFLDRLTDDEPTKRDGHGSSLGPGRLVGRYRLRAKIGEGGMSTVYLASRADDQFRKRVAIKLVPLAMASGEHLRRFRTERYILAGLDHPNIARLYDAGTTEEGLPYFVMELVEGEPIDAYCDHHRLSIRERLVLFRTVCSAVHYAHQNLVVHRDIKPSNVLVTENGVPKLLDFGVAKLLNPELASPGPQPAVTWHRVMTPQYASPEQIQGKTITTASDVYSLGVLLYKLLTGRLPHRLAGKTLQEIEFAVTRQEPERPSLAIRGSSPELHERSRARHARPGELRRQLAGDLDNIVLMALRREPQRRYRSAEQVAEDLERYLGGLPVRARQDTFSYRLGKFLRRNRVPVAAAAAVLALVLGLSATIALQTARIARERDQARIERDKARQISDFFQEVFEMSSPRQARGDRLSARDVLDRAASRVERELVEHPEVQASLIHTLGNVYASLALYDQAEALLRKALARRRQLLGETHPDVARSRNNLAATLSAKGDLEAAEALYRETLEAHRELTGDHRTEIAEALRGLALMAVGRGDFEAAEPLLRNALELQRTILGEDHPTTTMTLASLASTLSARGDHAAAEPLFEQAVSRQRATLGEAHADVARTLDSYGLMLYRKGDYERAETMLRRAVDLHRQVFGAAHPDLARSLSHLAEMLTTTGRYEEATEVFEEALAMARDHHGEAHPMVAAILGNMAATLVYRGDYDGAERLHRELLPILRKLYDDDHLHVVTALVNLAGIQTDKGRFEESEALNREALASLRRILGEEHPHVATTTDNLAKVLYYQGRFEEAEPLFRRAMAVRRELLGDDHHDTAISYVGLGVLLSETGRASEGEALLRRGLAIHARDLPPDHWRVGWASAALGGSLLALGRHEEAEALLLEGFATLEEALGLETLESRQTLDYLVALYETTGDAASADRYRARRASLAIRALPRRPPS